MTVILGPCACVDCRVLLVYARKDGWPPLWLEVDGEPHICGGRKLYHG